MIPDPNEMAKNAKQAEQFLKLLANQNRLMILCNIMQREMSVSELNQHVPLTQSALSQHLAALRQAGLVDTRREAKSIIYRICDQRAALIIQTLYGLFCHPDTEDTSTK
ncbi:ArsR/SmtB family transcription factor [Aestuariibacter salexigens]|uniref:ArsR/SmtB family transcription factor n=1 Tax=Aestuariibacter salexigens TaxID=226010 RepID=UPI0004146489|nr:metalloregulator ArsR/SmtB family transcription factor [Aestuariibacter salexigens]